MKNAFLSLVLLSCLSAAAQQQDIVSYYNDPGKHERNRNIDVTLMKLDVSFVPKEGKVLGKVTHTFTCLQDNVDTIFLNGPEINIVSATLDGKSIKTRSNAEGIICETALMHAYNSSHVLELEYTALPKRGIYFVGWNVEKIEDPIHQTRRQIWTQGQGIDNRHWIPMIDDRGDKFVTEVWVKFDKDYKVLSNGGLLEKKDNKDGTLSWHYKINHQHAGYLLMLAIDKYAVKSTKTKRGTPINFWYYPEQPQNLEPSSMYSEKIIEFLEEEIGFAYPWGSYSQVMVQDFLYGAMENTSATTFGDFFWTDNRSFLDRKYIGVNAHEATHQWFGDLITARNDADHWLQESFATYYPGWFTGSIYGIDEAYWYYRGNMNGALAAGKLNDLPVRNSEAGSARHYPKGASVLFMLQHVMGRDNFRRGIQLYLQRHQFSGVTTYDLEKAMLDATGMNMDWFFDQWIYRGGEPDYKVSWEKETNGTAIIVEQVHKLNETVGLFQMPVDVAVYYMDGTVDRKTIWVSQSYEKFVIPNKTGLAVDFVLFDEGSFVLKNVTFNKPLSELKLQLEKASFMLDRYDALVALGKFPLAERKDILLSAWKRETNKDILAEIVRQLASDPNVDPNFIADAYSSSKIEIRRAVINHTEINAATVATFEKALQDSSYQVIETALLKLWNFAPQNHSAYLEQIKNLDGQAMALKVRYLELGTEVFPDMRQSFINSLTLFCGEQYEFRTRINAMQALQRLNACNAGIVKNLYDAMLNFNSRLNAPAKDVLTYFKQQTGNLKIMREVLNSLGFSDADKEKLKTSLGL